MQCAICPCGIASRGETTVMLERGETLVVIKRVPAQVCSDCGEAYFAEDVSRRLIALGDDAVARGAEVEILRYAA